MFLIGFTFLNFSSILSSQGSILSAFGVLFGVLGTHLDDLRESLKQGGVWLARLAGQGDPNLRKHGKVMVDWRCLGVGNNQSSRVQATRLYTTSYQTVRIQDWKVLQATNCNLISNSLVAPGGRRIYAITTH